MSCLCCVSLKIPECSNSSKAIIPEPNNAPAIGTSISSGIGLPSKSTLSAPLAYSGLGWSILIVPNRAWSVNASGFDRVNSFTPFNGPLGLSNVRGWLLITLKTLSHTGDKKANIVVLPLLAV